jgi:peroxiredoxin
MRYLIPAAAAIALLGASLAHAQVDPAARQKLQEMADAAKQSQSLTYSVSYKGEGGFSSMLAETRADVAMLKDPGGQWKLRITGTRGPIMDLPALDFVVVIDGNTRKWQDDAAKVIYERPAHSARSEHLDVALLAALRELYQPNPFEKDLGAETIKLEPSTVVSGVPVDVVFVDPGQNQPQFRYYIGVADRMPRKVEQIIGALGSMVWTINNVLVSPPMAESAFKIDVPDGYTLDAPVRPQVQQPQTPQNRLSALRPRTVGTNVNDLAPDFTLVAADESEIALNSLRGNVAVLAFWGTWSAPSKRAITALQATHEKYSDQPVKIFALSFREGDEQNPRKYIQDQKITYPHLPKADQVASLYKVNVPPTFYVIGRQGEITFTASGFNQESIANLEQAIEAALGRGKATRELESIGGDAAPGGDVPRPAAGGEDADAAGGTDGGR